MPGTARAQIKVGGDWHGLEGHTVGKGPCRWRDDWHVVLVAGYILFWKKKHVPPSPQGLGRLVGVT